MSTTRSTNSIDKATRETLDRAIALGHSGKHAAALRLLRPLAVKHPKSGTVVGCLARAFYQSGNKPEAAEAFRAATKLLPRSELASLGLFHSLWDVGAEHEAFDEMQRFLTIADSDEYGQLLHDLAVEGRLGPKLETVGAA